MLLAAAGASAGPAEPAAGEPAEPQPPAARTADEPPEGAEAAKGAEPAEPATSEPQPPRRGVRFGDAWLGRIALDELERAARAKGLSELRGTMRAAIFARLACGRLEELEALTDMVYVLRACEYLPQTPDADFAAWLLAHRPVARRLFRAIQEVGSAREPLAKLHTLYEHDAQAVARHPDLAVAFATSTPLPAPRSAEPIKRATLLESWRWYTETDVDFRCDLRKTPYEVARFLADTRLSIEERAWAVRHYHDVDNPARLFHKIEYDNAHYRHGEKKRISRVAYTLANIRKYGGVCAEQAYFASEVCKALGLPAARVTGRGKSGTHHAWVACVRAQGGRAQWDSRTGRYENHKYYTGRMRDPATGKQLYDTEVMLATLAAQLSLRRREEADLATALARRVHGYRGEVKADALLRLGRLYNARFAEGSRPEALIDWITPSRKLDDAMVRDLLAVALERNLAHRGAWDFILELTKAGDLSAKQAGRFLDVLVRRTRQTCPEYACDMVLRLVEHVPDVAQRLKLYGRCAAAFGRPDLRGRVLLRVGDLHREQEDPERALRAYGQAAETCLEVPTVALRAARRAEDLLLAAEKLAPAIHMYEHLLDRAEKVDSDELSIVRSSTHYQLGLRLIHLHGLAGDADAARRVRRIIEP